VKHLILASSSPRRRELLRQIGLSFGLARPDINETPQPGEPAESYVERLSREKALAIRVDPSAPPALILSADTIVVLDGEIIGKPADAADAVLMLERLRGRGHLVHTGISVRDTATGTISTALTTTEVFMRSYADSEIEAYVASGEPFDKAGGYAVQDATFHPVERLVGCYTNVMGLPLCTVYALLAQAHMMVPLPPLCSSKIQPCQWANGR
jgi:septum formation protein